MKKSLLSPHNTIQRNINGKIYRKIKASKAERKTRREEKHKEKIR